MKRFWKAVEAVQHSQGWAIRLDGRPLRTPARAELAIPSFSLAAAIRDEWRDAPETVNPRDMLLSGLANAAIDKVAPDASAFATGLARYAEADLLCYRAGGPTVLVTRQTEAWDSLLVWARRRYDVEFRTTTGVLHVPQPDSTIQRLSNAVGVLEPFQLAALSPLVTISASLVAGLAVCEQALPLDEVWQAVSIDEIWQLEQWGSDSEAELALENRRLDFFAAARFLGLLQKG